MSDIWLAPVGNNDGFLLPQGCKVYMISFRDIEV
jgi:hypothetical protein